MNRIRESKSSQDNKVKKQITLYKKKDSLYCYCLLLYYIYNIPSILFFKKKPLKFNSNSHSGYIIVLGSQGDPKRATLQNPSNPCKLPT